MSKLNWETVGWIQAKRLTGKGPFPPALHKLGVRTNRLRSSIRATAPRIEGNSVVSEIGTNVVYARVHEFGFDGKVPIFQHQVRSFLRRVAGKKRRRRVKEHTRGIFGPAFKRLRMPQRMPIAAGLADRADIYGRRFSQAIERAWKESKTSE